jgi:hypothetical protein
MIIFLIVITTFIVLRKSGVYHKELGNSGIEIGHIANALVYLIMLCICAPMAIILFLIFDAKSLYNKLKLKGGD